MINLEKQSGLPIELTDDYHLKFNAPLNQVTPAVRKFSDMVPVLMDQHAKPEPAREEMYYMYRNIHQTADEHIILKNNLRYDITILPPVMLGKEFNKTVGHYHPLIPGQPFAYPELYEVLAGEGLFLIQKMDAELNKLITVMAIRGKVGDKIIYPPNYAHVIVNTGTGPLVTANWVADKFESIYEPIRDRHGMAYYAVRDEQNGFNFVANQNYQDIPAMRVIEAFADPGFGLSPDEPMYLTGIRDIGKLEFLNKPHKYAVQLSTISS